jgi:predicted nucleotide-binding protein
MPKTRIFIGSSSASKTQAKAVVKAFESPTVEFVPWWGAFTPGRTLLEDLDSIKAKVDAALLLFAPEAESTVRGNVVQTPNLNVLFEFGYFYGHFGKQKVAMLKYGSFYLPSDLGGYIHINGSKFFKRGAVVQVGKRTTGEFTKWVAQV